MGVAGVRPARRNGSAPRTRRRRTASLGHEPHLRPAATADRGRARRRRQPHDAGARHGHRPERRAAVRQRPRDHRPRRADGDDVHAGRPDADRRARRHRVGRPARSDAGHAHAVPPAPERRDRQRARAARHHARPGFAPTATSTPTTRTARCATACRASPPPATARQPATETVVWQNSVNADIWHQGGDLHFGPDGNLYISVGDHLQSQTAQSLTSYNGKILRVTRDGTAPADNPFYDGAGPNLDAIWVRGLRNPFRFTIDPPTGRMIIADVGQDTLGGGQRRRRAAPTTAGRPARARARPPGMTNPVYSLRPHRPRRVDHRRLRLSRHEVPGATTSGDYFFADYAQNWIRRLTFDANGNVSAVRNFEPPDGTPRRPVRRHRRASPKGPDGSLWYVDAGPFETANAGAMRRIRNVNANQPPAAVAAVNSDARPRAAEPCVLERGLVRPRRAAADATAGTSATARRRPAEPGHTYTRSGRYNARLTTPTARCSTSSEPADDHRGSPPGRRSSRRPTGARSAPATTSLLRRRHRPEDGPLPAIRRSMEDRLPSRHATSTRCWTRVGSSGTLTIPTRGHSFRGDTNYEIDPDGDRLGRDPTSTSVTIRPQKATLTIATVAGGLSLTLDGISQAHAGRLRRAGRVPPHGRRPVAAAGAGPLRVLAVVGRRRAVAHRHRRAERADAHGELHAPGPPGGSSPPTASTRATGATLSDASARATPAR